MKKVKKEFVDLESHMINARRVKVIKAHKDRLLDALRDLTLATQEAPGNLTDAQKSALDKAVVALQYHHVASQNNKFGL